MSLGNGIGRHVPRWLASGEHWTSERDCAAPGGAPLRARPVPRAPIAWLSDFVCCFCRLRTRYRRIQIVITFTLYEIYSTSTLELVSKLQWLKKWVLIDVVRGWHRWMIIINRRGQRAFIYAESVVMFGFEQPYGIIITSRSDRNIHSLSFKY